MKMTKLPYRVAPLLVALASSCAFAVTPDRPQPSDYDNFNTYIRALVDYRKSVDPVLPVDRNTSSTLSGDNQESLEDAVAKAQSGWTPGYTDTSRSTSKSFPLTPISSDDLNRVDSPDSISGLAALSNNTLDQLKPNRDVSNERNLASDERVRSDVRYATMLNVQLEAYDMLGGTIFLEDDSGYAVVDIETNKLTDGGLHLGLSAKLRARVAFVDKDGLPGSYPRAGAVVMDPLRLDIKNLGVDIHGMQRGNQRYIQVDSYLGGGLQVDLSRTRIGTASWLGGRRTGEMSPFLAIGEGGQLNIASGTMIRTTLTRPDAHTPFATVNGRIGDLSLSDISLIDNDDGGVIHIGKLSITGINLVDTKVYFDNGAIRLDTGRGLTNVGVRIERLALGAADDAHVVGDFYARGMRINSNVITIRAH